MALGPFLRRQVVEVLVQRLSGIDTVLNPVEPGQQHCRKSQIRIA